MWLGAARAPTTTNMREHIKFIYPQNLVPANGKRNEHGLFKMIPKGADGSFNAKDIGVSVGLSEAGRQDLERLHAAQINSAASFFLNRNPFLVD